MQQTFAENNFLSEMPNTILTTVEYLETGADEQSGIIMKNTKGDGCYVSDTSCKTAKTRSCDR